MSSKINPMPKLPPDSKPIIRGVGWHSALCIAIGLLCSGLVVIGILIITNWR